MKKWMDEYDLTCRDVVMLSLFFSLMCLISVSMLVAAGLLIIKIGGLG